MQFIVFELSIQQSAVKRGFPTALIALRGTEKIV